eukprot:136884-Chlamydomonas_euryale.AAC.2
MVGEALVARPPRPALVASSSTAGASQVWSRRPASQPYLHQRSMQLRQQRVQLLRRAHVLVDATSSSCSASSASSCILWLRAASASAAAVAWSGRPAAASALVSAASATSRRLHGAWGSR